MCRHPPGECVLGLAARRPLVDVEHMDLLGQGPQLHGVPGDDSGAALDAECDRDTLSCRSKMEDTLEGVLPGVPRLGRQSGKHGTDRSTTEMQLEDTFSRLRKVDSGALKARRQGVGHNLGSANVGTKDAWV